MAVYTAAQRKKYATVGKKSYPIGDKSHARNALARLNQGGLSSAQKAKVRAKARRVLGRSKGAR